MDLIRLNVLPPDIGADRISSLVIASGSTRIVKSFAASRWEVFLCPEHAARLSIYLPAPSSSTKSQPKGR